MKTPTNTGNATNPSAPFPPDLFKRWFLYGLAALAGGQLVFAVISGFLDNLGPVLNVGGHLILVGLGAGVYYAQRRALKMTASWIAALICGIVTFLAYGLAFALLGPPMDFLLSVVGLGLATGIALWLSLRPTRSNAPWSAAAIGVGYAVGAVLAVAAAMAFGDTVNRVFGGGLTGFMGVVGMIGVIEGLVGSLLSGLALSRTLAGTPTLPQPTVPAAS